MSEDVEAFLERVRAALERPLLGQARGPGQGTRRLYHRCEDVQLARRKGEDASERLVYLAAEAIRQGAAERAMAGKGGA